MASNEVVVEPPIEWLSVAITYLLWIIPNFFVLYSEIKQRQKSSVSFTTKFFELFSFMCIISGFLHCVFAMLTYVPGLCAFSFFLQITVGVLLVLSMGFYQLSRLYYCFANNQVHSNKGYPKWVFVIMYTIGILYGFMVIMSLQLSDVVDSLFRTFACGYNDNFEYFYYPMFTEDSYRWSTYWAAVTVLLYAFWDLITLLLYGWKIRAYIDKDNLSIVFTRIMSILFKITILTLFYQFMAYISLVIAMLYYELNIIPAISVILANFMANMLIFTITFSMYLMMDHNEEKYYAFLKWIKYTRIYLMCCCCRFIVIKQLNELYEKRNNLEKANSASSPRIDQKKEATHLSETQFQTQDNYIEDRRIHQTGMELSMNFPSCTDKSTEKSTKEPNAYHSDRLQRIIQNASAWKLPENDEEIPMPDKQIFAISASVDDVDERTETQLEVIKTPNEKNIDRNVKKNNYSQEADRMREDEMGELENMLEKIDPFQIMEDTDEELP